LDASVNHAGNGLLIVIASSYTSGLQLDSSDGCKLLAETDFHLAVAQFINHARGLFNAKVQVHAANPAMTTVAVPFQRKESK